MADCIKIEGIKTNNLKGIDISLEKLEINLIIGPSGSGKSSLAYDTVAQIGQHEFMAMFADDVAEPSYVVKGYHNMVASIPIKQSNFNNNLHSTIGTYFGLNRNISLIYAALLGIPEDNFTLNKAGNLCEKCHGLGIVSILDESRIIDYNVPLEKNPIRCWNKYKDFYAHIIEKYCADQGIDSSKTIRQLSCTEKESILYGESPEKYSIRFKKTNMFSRRTTKYYGVMTENPMITNFTPGKQFYSDRECDCCKGRKYSAEHEQYRIYDLSIGEFMTLPFSELAPVIKKMSAEIKDSRLTFALTCIRNFITKAVELNLGHLFFHRAIPTLSGGELQRLKMVQVFNSQLTDLLIVLDEPLAGLSGNEKQAILENILLLAKRHTVLIVDHSDIFVKESKKIYALGPGSGSNGGSLIDSTEYLAYEAISRSMSVRKATAYITVQIINDVYQYKGVKISLADKCMNLVTGASGIGKSTLLREYFPQQFDEYLYISQKPLVGNKNSYVATALDIFGKISDIFAKKTGKDRRLFSNLTGNGGTCPVCCGGGFIEYGYNSRTKVRLVCEECEGTGFNKILKKYKVNQKSIYDIWNMTLDEGLEYFKPFDPKITATLKEATSIMLGHLRIGQATTTLSGGENIRIKILKASKSTSKILGIDEPFKGLSPSEIFLVACFLDRIRAKGKTIVVVDHSEVAEQYFTRKLVLLNQDSILTDMHNKSL
ncbi:excinuclease [Bacillus sp. DNRA2]|uniref:excinuclease n=1 Tax=Bacillus sp. DNRA2 TaxID=2723053 RepID=UPI00145CDDBA|nr:excinuclease [Bacillus sp. DNRA2]NMD71292.1 excinuclease [Bacillus sp. DNRA2]